MKYIWNGINTSLIILGIMYLYITEDINTKAHDKCLDLEKKVELHEKMINNLTEIATQRDTIVVNIKNYSVKNYTNTCKDED